MSDNSQLFKKENNGYKEVYPLSYIQNIIDAETKEKLSDILIRYNHIYVPWQDNVTDTRLSVPKLMRRKGLWISYDKEGTLYTEYFKLSTLDAMIDSYWESDDNWEIVPNLEFVRNEASKLPDGIVTPEKLSPALQELIKQNNKITNLPDDEDLEEKCNVIKFKDREYNPYMASGKGYKILRKNWVGGYNTLTQDMVNKENTVYEIRYDFNLRGEEITIPEGCTLKFEGGSFKNGIMKFQNTYIVNGNFVNMIDFQGTIKNEIIYASWFNCSQGDDTNNLYFILNQGSNKTIELENREYSINSLKKMTISDREPAYIINKEKHDIYIHGNNATIHDFADKTTIGGKLAAFLRFESCYNVDVIKLNYKWEYEAVIDPKVEGIIVIRTVLECSNFNIDIDVTNAGRGMYCGNFASNTVNVGKGINNSNIKIKAYKVGYPIAVEIGEKLNIINYFDTVHRGVYIAGVVDSTIYSIGKDTYPTKVNLLLTDAVDITGFKYCKGIKAKVVDTGTTNVSDVSTLCVYQLYNSYEPYKSRTTPYKDITIDLDVESLGNASCGFEVFHFSGKNDVIGDFATVNITSRLNKHNSSNRLFRTNSLINGNYNFNNCYIEEDDALLVTVATNDIKENVRITYNKCTNINLSIPAQINEKCGSISIVDSSIHELRFVEGDTDYFPNINIDNSNITSEKYAANTNPKYITNNFIKVDNIRSMPIAKNIIANISSNQTLSFRTTIPKNFSSTIVINNISSSEITGKTKNKIFSIDAGRSICILYYRAGSDVRTLKLHNSEFQNVGSTTVRNSLEVVADDEGFVFFDTTLKKPLWWNGSAWVDATGATV